MQRALLKCAAMRMECSFSEMCHGSRADYRNSPRCTNAMKFFLSRFGAVASEMRQMNFMFFAGEMSPKNVRAQFVLFCGSVSNPNGNFLFCSFVYCHSTGLQWINRRTISQTMAKTNCDDSEANLKQIVQIGSHWNDCRTLGSPTLNERIKCFWFIDIVNMLIHSLRVPINSNNEICRSYQMPTWFRSQIIIIMVLGPQQQSIDYNSHQVLLDSFLEA